MALDTPFGNGPQDIKAPVPGQQSMGDMYNAMPSTPPPMRAPAAQPQSSQAPAPAQAPASAPAANIGDYASPANFGDYGAPAEDGDIVGGIFGQGEVKREKGKVKIKVGESWHDVSDDAWDKVQSIGSTLAETARLGGMMAGAAIGGAATASNPVTAAFAPAGAAAGGGVGYDAGDSLVKMTKLALGIKDEDTRDQMLDHINNMVKGTAMEAGGQMMGVAAKSFADSGLRVAAGQAGGLSAAETAAKAAGPAIADASAAGTKLLPNQTAPDTVAGGQQAQIAAQIQAGQYGRGPQAQLETVLNQQKADLQNSWNDVKESYGPLAKQAFDKGINVNEVFQPGKAIDDVIAQQRKGIGTYKPDVLNNLGDAKVDPTQILAMYDGFLERSGMMKDGQPVGMDLADESARELVRQRLYLKELVERDAGGFGTGNGVVEQKIADEKGALLGSSNPEYVTPPNEAGNAESGVPLKSLDGLIDAAQDHWKKLSQKGDPGAAKFGVLQRLMNSQYQDAIDSVSQKRFASPELKNSIDMMRRYNDQYSQSVDALSKLSAKVSSNPQIAISQIIRPDNPEEVAQLFHSLPQDVADQMRGQFLAHLEQRGASTLPDRLFDAKSVAKELSQYTPETLDTIFNGQGDRVKAIVNTAQRLQNAPITTASAQQSTVVHGIARDLARIPGDMYKSAVALFRKNKDLYEYMSRPDFQDQVNNYRQALSGKTATMNRFISNNPGYGNFAKLQASRLAPAVNNKIGQVYDAFAPDDLK